MAAIAVRASKAPITVPMADGDSAMALVSNSHLPSPVAGNEWKAATASKLETANGQISRGLSRRATAAPAKVMNVTKALNGMIRMPEKSTE